MSEKETETETVKNKKPIYKRWWFIILIIIVIGGILAEPEDGTPKSASTSSTSSTENKVESPKTVDLRTSCSEILLQIESNEVKAVSLYANKNILINGTIQGIQSDTFDNPLVILSHTDEYSVQYCSLSNVPKDYALELSKGKSISLLCDSFEEMVGDALLFNCAPYKQ